MINKIIEKTQKLITNPWIPLIVLVIMLILSFWSPTRILVSAVAIAANAVMSIYIFTREDNKKGILGIGLLLAQIFLFGLDNVGSPFMCSLLAFFSFRYLILDKTKEGYIISAIVIATVLLAGYSEDSKADALYYIILTAHALGAVLFFSVLFKRKAGTTIYIILIVIFTFISKTFCKYRFGFMGIQDFLSLPTFLEVSSGYKNFISIEDLKILIIPAVVILTLLLIEEDEIKEHRFIVAFFAAVIFILTVLPLGTITKASIEQYTECRGGAIDMLYVSVADEMDFYQYDAHKQEQQDKVAAFPSDEKIASGMSPHIVTVMCESYADIENIYPILLSKDPIFNVNGSNVRTGKTRCGVFGGGTSRSEFEYNTGISLKNVSMFRNPYLQDANINVSFTADPLYNEYEKTFIHPFRSAGWNREKIYNTYEYDHILFENDFDNNSERFRSFISDSVLYKKIEDKLKNAKCPQYIMGVTIHGHGGYEDKLDSPPVKVLNENPMKDNYETYLGCVDASTNALYDFLDFLDDNRDIPTIFIFFGDHFPADLEEVPEDKKNDAFYTPYLIYSNYCSLDPVPEKINMCQLLPYAKQAAGLGLTSWEKYLISLKEEVPDKDMGYTRLKIGYF